jgi:hypothetical protein
MALPVTFVAGDVLEAQQLNDNFDYLDGAGGLTLVKTQLIGTSVGSVTVTDAFNTNYESYKIIINGGVCSSTNSNILMQLGATTTGYYWALVAFNASAVGGAGANNSSSMQIGEAGTSIISVNCEIINPFLALNTTFGSTGNFNITNNNGRLFTGVLQNTTSYTDFTLTPSLGTLTGGTIRVYGYGK